MPPVRVLIPPSIFHQKNNSTAYKASKAPRECPGDCTEPSAQQAARKISAFKRYDNVPVSSGSLIRIDRNRYSVPSRLIGEKVNVVVHPEHLTVYHGTLEICKMPRLRGQGKAEVNWRHLIDGLVRKPSA